jgi:hypothetical protein
LFIRQSNRSDLQKRLDRDQEQGQATALAEPREAREAAEKKPIFQGSKKQGFQVDLWGGWVKP